MQQRCNRGATEVQQELGLLVDLLYYCFTLFTILPLYYHFTTPLYYLDREVMEATEELGLLVDLLYYCFTLFTILLLYYSTLLPG